MKPWFVTRQARYLSTDPRVGNVDDMKVSCCGTLQESD